MIPDDVLRQITEAPTLGGRPILTDPSIPHGMAVVIPGTSIPDLARELLAAREALRGLMVIHSGPWAGNALGLATAASVMSGSVAAARACLPEYDK